MTEEEQKTTEEEPEKKKLNKVEKVYVFLTDLPGRDGEGIVSIPTPGGLIPLVALDEKQFGSFSKQAQQMANESGKDIWAVAFTSREEVARFERKLVEVPKMGISAKVGKVGEGGWKIGG